jgi:hypothetical protein
VLRAAVLPTLRATPLAPAAACCLLSVGLLLVVGRHDRMLGLLLFAILLTSFGAGFALDDEAVATLEASPTTLLTRRALRVAGLLAVLGVGTVVQVAAAALVVPVSPGALGGWLLEDAAFVAVTLAASAIAQRLLPEQAGGLAAAPTGLLLLATVATFAKFDPWLSPVPDAPHSERWAWVMAGGVAVLAALSRDPAHRFLRPSTIRE